MHCSFINASASVSHGGKQQEKQPALVLIWTYNIDPYFLPQLLHSKKIHRELNAIFIVSCSNRAALLNAAKGS